MKEKKFHEHSSWSRSTIMQWLIHEFLVSGVGGIQVSTRYTLPNCFFHRLVSLPKLHRETKASTVGYLLHVNCLVSFSDSEHSCLCTSSKSLNCVLRKVINPCIVQQLMILSEQIWCSHNKYLANIIYNENSQKLIQKDQLCYIN